MAVYHVSRKGEPAVCRAKAGRCPLAGLEGQAHGTREEVLQAIEVNHGGVTPTPIAKMTEKEKVWALRDELFAAAQAYYQGGQSSLTDDEYDDKKTYLGHLVRASRDPELAADPAIRAILEETVAAGTSVADDVKTVRRTIPMLSQRKADTRAEVEDYLREALAAGATGFKLQAKLDGISFAAVYEEGKLAHCTGRGDGSRGQDYTDAIVSGSVKVEGLPLSLDGEWAKGRVEVRGELFVRRSRFEAANDERENNGAPRVGHPQIMVSSSLNRGSAPTTFTFVMFSKIRGGADGEEFDQFESSEAEAQGFVDITALTDREWRLVQPALGDFTSLSDLDDLMAQIDNFGDARPYLDIPTDGVVVKPINEVEMLARMGSTAHHPRSQVAFKYTGAMGVSPVRDLVWTVRGSGEIAAQVVFDELELDGKNFGRTSLPYALQVEEVGLGPGAEILVEKYRDQAAKFRSVQAPGQTTYEVPSSCPSCSGPLSRSTNRPDPGNRLPEPYTSLYCANEYCRDRVLASYGWGGIEYEGLGPAKVKTLLEEGMIRTTADLVTFTAPEKFKRPDGTYPKGFTVNNVGKLAAAVRSGRDSLKDDVETGLASLHLYGLTRDRIALLAEKYGSIAAIEEADVRDLADAFREDLHETEQTNMLPTAEACAERLQEQLRNSSMLKTYRTQGVRF